VAGCTATGRIPQEFANRQLGDIDAGIQEIDAVSHLFRAHSADLVKSYM
jgi:hypothetical protein